MTLFQVEELTSYWAQHPPLHLLIAAYLGVGKYKELPMPPASAGRGQRPTSDVGSMLSQLGPGFGTWDVHVGFSPVVLDFAELRCRATVSD